MQVAATAMSHDLTLVTRNTKHFVPYFDDLRVEDWS
jgi:predicted nucleic acid-binding protein